MKTQICISEELQRYRLKNKLSIEELSRKIGVSYFTCWKWLHGAGVSSLAYRRLKEGKFI